MHSIAEIGTNVPAFLGKLWKMVEDPVTNDLIAWSSTGTSFVIKDESRFARELLPMYYKHNNMASFIRQLNMYGFHKIVSPDAGSMKLETPDEIKFTHPYFLRGHPYLLDNIKRKIGVSKVLSGQLGEKTPQVINKVLCDVRQMKGRQEGLDNRLTAMKMENEALWRELSVLRQKHVKQQQIVNKLIQFLVTIVQQNHNTFSVKRRYPRMLQHHDKSSQQAVTHTDNVEHLGNNLSDMNNSPTGPVIHELDPAEALLETVVEEAEVDTSSDNVPNYFLNTADSENIQEMEVNANDTLDPVNVYCLDDVDAETIVGLPEDTLMNTYLTTPQPNKEAEVTKPKYVKLITKIPKKNGDTKQKPKQMIFVDPQKQMEQTLQQQLQINQDQLVINKQLLLKNKQQLQSQPLRLQKTQQAATKSGKILLKQKPQKKQGVVSEQKAQSNSEQLPQSPQQVLLQRLQQTTQSPPSTTDPIITIPFETRPQENITSNSNQLDLEPMLVDGTAPGYSLPIIVEVPSLPGSPAQPSTSPAALSPQDLLLGSPVLTNDPVMAPQVNASPIISSPIASPPEPPRGDMQVACVEDNNISRSAHQNLFKVDSSDYSRAEMDSHIDSVQNDLDSLKELLRSEGISLDANTLLGYFNDDPLSFNMSDPINPEQPKESSGTELMACNPSMFDFSDLMGNDWSLPTSPGDNITAEDTFAEVNTPQFVPQSPSFPTPSKKRKK